MIVDQIKAFIEVLDKDHIRCEYCKNPINPYQRDFCFHIKSKKALIFHAGCEKNFDHWMNKVDRVLESPLIDYIMEI